MRTKWFHVWKVRKTSDNKLSFGCGSVVLSKQQIKDFLDVEYPKSEAMKRRLANHKQVSDKLARHVSPTYGFGKLSPKQKKQAEKLLEME